MAETPQIRRSPLGPGVLAFAITLVAMWPYTAVIQPGIWTFVVVTIVVVTAVIGILSRAVLARLGEGIRSLLTLGLQLAALIVTCTTLLASESAVAGLFPTATTVRLVGQRLQRALEEITTGVAPIDSTVSMATAIGLAFAIVAVLIDQLVGSRVIVLTVLFSSLVGVAPMLISFGAINFAWFVMQAIMILLILRFGARLDAREARRPRWLMASIAGVAAIALTIVTVPALPLASALPGTGPALTVNADLRLGDDLRRPDSVEALTLVTSAAKPPYLRLATLSRFNGEVWRPDRTSRVPLEEGFGERQWPKEIKTIEHQVSIRMLGVSGSELPVPYAAESVTGIEDGWQAMRTNRTVISRTQNSAGSDYTVKMATPAPTLEQIRASSASDLSVVPEPTADLPPIIAELAREVTADADTDYDKLIALQDWFRSDFSYSLDAPVAEGFDGTGAEAVVAFLEQRTGYCIHFAGAFALMAQTLEMPVRIVVGYLPGTATTKKVAGDIVYSVTSDKLHSWPEVYFDGIGWVPFEPTATLGDPTEFIAAAPSGEDPDDPNAPQPSASQSSAPSVAPSLDPDAGDQGLGGGSDLRSLNPLPVLLVGLGVLLLVLLPACVRQGRRLLRTGRARQGDAMAAWLELSDTLVDLGWPASEADTARMRAAALTERGVSAEPLSALVDAVELRSYAAVLTVVGDLSTPLRDVVSQLHSKVDARQRVLAVLLPASLFTARGR